MSTTPDTYAAFEAWASTIKPWWIVDLSRYEREPYRHLETRKALQAFLAGRCSLAAPAATMTPSDLVASIKRGERWQLVEAAAPAEPTSGQGASPHIEPLTWHPAAGPKLPDADAQCLLWIRYRDGTEDWESGWLDGDGWRLCESGGLADGEVLFWAMPGGPGHG